MKVVGRAWDKLAQIRYRGDAVLQGIARLAIAAPRRVIAVAVLVMIATAIFGIPVMRS